MFFVNYFCMKRLLYSTLFSLILGFPLCSQNTAISNKIEHTEINFPCAYIDGLHIIRTQTQLDSLILSLDSSCLKKSSYFPEINLKKYSLIGFGSGASGCSKPSIALDFQKEKKKKVVLHIQIESAGSCKGYFYEKKWCLIPKLKRKAEVMLDTKRIHLNQ